jgi:hypothetical protein
MKVGFLYPYHSDHYRLFSDFQEIGGRADAYEFLGIHFTDCIEELKDFTSTIDAPIETVHVAMCQLGNANREQLDRSIEKLNKLAKASKAKFIGEHFATMGSERIYSGSFLPPLFSTKHKEKLVENINYVSENLECDFAIENPVEFFAYKNEDSQSKYFAEVCDDSDTDIVLSLSNIIMSEEHHSKFDREELLSNIDISKVRQVHLFINNLADEKKDRYLSEKQAWLFRTLDQLLNNRNFSPEFICFETVAETPSLVEAERLKEMMDHYRGFLK